MNMTINPSIVKEYYSKTLIDEIEEYLNEAIDLELEKDDVDTDFIDECIDALDMLSSGTTAPALRLILTEKQIKAYCKKNTKNNSHKKAIAACLIVAACSSAALLSTNTAVAGQIKDVFNQVISALNITAVESESKQTVSSVYAEFPKDYSFEIKSEEDIDLSGIKIYALYQDNTKKQVPLSDCTVKKTESFDGNPDHILVVIAYEGCAFSVTYTLEG